MAVLVVSTDAGDFAIQEDEVSTITAAELCQLRISRADLRRLFAEAAKLLLGIRPAIRPGWLRPDRRTAIRMFTPIPTTKQPRYNFMRLNFSVAVGRYAVSYTVKWLQQP
jgi:hypothetical protein